VEWIESTCRLYEGDRAGELITLMDWQRDFLRRLFGWVRWSERLDREVRRFTRATLFVPKKAGKSPLIACVGLYLLLGDGEKGQKVYSAAKDGKQAAIAHTHALEMVKRSPELGRMCGINNTTGQITHHADSGVYKIVAGDNIASQEGLNGSVLIDEAHVVDRRLAEVLRYAGASRAEPLQIEVSTAGSDPSSWGKERFDYAAGVIKDGGDTATLCVIYAAPQDLSHADLDADPEKYGRVANPSWGVTIDPERFLAEYRKAKKSLSELIAFMRYRLNVWSQAASPWLREADWSACRRDYAEADLEGQDCWAGLDLSRTHDMSALVLAFHDGEEDFRLLPYFWMPEDRARELAHLAKYREWAASGHLTLTPGNVIAFAWIEAEFRRLAKRFRIKELAYDLRFAEDVTQRLEQGATDDEGKVLAEGTGVTRFQFQQSAGEFALPTADFERAVLSGRMGHAGHPVLSWQAGHVKVKSDANRNKRPVKPPHGDHRTIDGIVAAIMAVARARAAPRLSSVYELHWERLPVRLVCLPWPTGSRPGRAWPWSCRSAWSTAARGRRRPCAR
jgi:phage terminase large subunit-like protein